MCMGGCGGGKTPSTKSSGGAQKTIKNWGGMPKGGSGARGGSATPKTVSGPGRFGKPSVSMSFGKKKY